MIRSVGMAIPPCCGLGLPELPQGPQRAPRMLQTQGQRFTAHQESWAAPRSERYLFEDVVFRHGFLRESLVSRVTDTLHWISPTTAQTTPPLLLLPSLVLCI